jgi:hypothetical protein
LDDNANLAVLDIRIARLRRHGIAGLCLEWRMSRLAAKQTDLFALQPTAESGSLTDADLRRIRLPGDLPASLKYVDNAELERLREAVSSEITRRGLSLQTEPATLLSPTDQRSVLRSKKQPDPSEIPVGKASLIHAAFKAGLKPAAIARSLRIPPSLVRDVLSSSKKPKKSVRLKTY